MLISTPAIIFKSFPYRETSLILEAYTRTHGLRKYLINGVRKAKARTPANMLQVMNLVDIVAYEREDRDLNRLKEVRLAKPYQQIPFDLKRGTLGLFMLEVTRRSVREAEANEALFDYMFDGFAFLDDCSGPIANLHLHYLLGLTAYLGFLPMGSWREQMPFLDLRRCEFCAHPPAHPDYLTEELSAMMYSLLVCKRESLHELTIGRQARNQLLDAVLLMYKHQIESLGEINSLSVLREVF
ncbi:MAG: DNA repair protein RecO [Bacteroidota bacterium]